MCEFTVDCNFCRETNLKVRQALPSTAALYDYVDQLGNFDGMCSIFLYMYPTCNGQCVLCSITLYLMVYVTWLLVCVCGGGGVKQMLFTTICLYEIHLQHGNKCIIH